MPKRPQELWRLVAGLGTIAGVTLLYVRGLHVHNTATVSTTFLLVVLVMAATSRLWIAIAVSIVAMLSFNFFFLPPVGTFSIVDPQNWVALFAFLVVSLIASRLSAGVRARTDEAVARRDELARLFDLSRDVLMMTDSQDAMSRLARAIALRFDLSFVAVALPRTTDWELFTAGRDAIDLSRQELSNAFASAQTTLEYDAHARTYSGHRTMMSDNRLIHLVPLRAATKAIGMLGASGRSIEAGTLDALAGIAAIAIERAQFLEDRKQAELTRQSEQLKAALLASLGHDLRTPLTTIRVAASNVKSSSLTAGQRDEQSDLILSEAERLARLFENILEMARIDAGAVASEARWTHPSEILEGARDQVGATIRDRRVIVHIGSDVPVLIDPRLTANAVAHVLENAAQYAPTDSNIDIAVDVTPEGLTFDIRDRGPGIAAADLPHLFERFYRGDAAGGRTSGTGMGLWIARRLLAVQHGRIWAENAAGGGARFSIVIPVPAKTDQIIDNADTV
ncbi:MAG: ATP-binding protein [Vicinamibacterales bacterium]